MRREKTDISASLRRGRIPIPKVPIRRFHISINDTARARNGFERHPEHDPPSPKRRERRELLRK